MLNTNRLIFLHTSQLTCLPVHIRRGTSAMQTRADYNCNLRTRQPHPQADLMRGASITSSPWPYTASLHGITLSILTTLRAFSRALSLHLNIFIHAINSWFYRPSRQTPAVFNTVRQRLQAVLYIQAVAVLPLQCSTTILVSCYDSRSTLNCATPRGLTSTPVAPWQKAVN